MDRSLVIIWSVQAIVQTLRAMAQSPEARVVPLTGGRHLQIAFVLTPAQGIIEAKKRHYERRGRAGWIC